MSGKNEILIQVRDLQKHFGSGSIHALDGVSTGIRRGEVVKKLPEEELLGALREELIGLSLQ